MGLFDRLRGKRAKDDPAAALRDACTGAGDEDEAAVIERVVMATRDRPEPARRALAGVVDNARRHGRTPSALVVDDARAPAPGGFPPGTRVLDRPARAAWAERLAEAAGVDAALVRFALLGEPAGASWPTSGACRNAGMLAGAGGGVLFIDDDTECRLAPSAAGATGLALSSAADASELHFYASLDQATDRAAGDVDLLGAHQEMLGLMAATCIEALPADAPLDLASARAGLIEAVTTGDAWVRATMLGTYGDSGMGTPNYFLTLRGAARDRLLADYPAHRLTRAVARGVPRATLSAGRWVMTPHLALDLRDWAPPFPPAGRNSDGLFAAVLRQTRPTDSIGYPPWLVARRPAEARAFTDDDLFSVMTRLVPAHQVMLWVTSYQPEAGADAEARQQALGRELCDAGRMAADAYRDLVRELHATDLAARAAYFTESLDQYDDQPADWAADLQRAIALAAAPAEPEDPEAVRQLLVGYGELLLAWPRLVEAALADRSPGT